MERGLKALVYLSAQRSMGVTELAQKLDVNKSTAYRILSALKEHNMVQQCPDNLKYKLGPAVLKMSEQLYKNLNIISIAKPLMQELSDKTGESAHLCILSNDSAVVVEQIMTNTRLAVNAKIGNSEPLHASSVGKCLLAFCDDETQNRILDRLVLEQFTPKTIVDKSKLKQELETIKRIGLAFDDGEISLEIRCVATPIFDHREKVVYSLGISGPSSRMDAQKVESVSQRLLETAKQISQNLGYLKGGLV